ITLSLPPSATSSRDSFTWVQPMVDNRERKDQSRIDVPKFDVVAALLGTSPPKKAKTASRLISESTGQEFLEIARPKEDKNEKDISVSDFELTRISLGESIPEGEVHNLRETFSKVIERVKKGKQTQEQLEEQVQVLANFIKSFLSSDKTPLDPTPLSALPPTAATADIDLKAITKIHRHATFGKASEAWVEKILSQDWNLSMKPVRFMIISFQLKNKSTQELTTLNKEIKIWAD
ncbi:hypothetical protein KI387_017638, partial [Taxus chinensis]